MRLSSWDIRIYTAELVLAIEQAHAIGFIHRDIKPQNIFIGPGGHIVLGDFSLVVWPQVASDATWEDGVVREDFPVATGGRYAPEQLRGEPCTYKVDIWALGLVLLEMYQGNGNVSRLCTMPQG
ncbi:kinase-like domain-containing protein [Amylostereum chailletii]|nr:kinase-like domain-containing protein [Amylostereum chailletii]